MSSRQTHITTKLNEEETFKLVNLYHKEECLWDVRNPDYKNQARRSVAHESILKAMGKKNFGVTELKHKIKNLRCTYNQEYAKIQKTLNTESPYVPNVKWYGTMDAIYSKLKWESPHPGEVLNILWPVKTEEEFKMEDEVGDPDTNNQGSENSMDAVKQVHYSQNPRGKRRYHGSLPNQNYKAPKLENTFTEYENYNCPTSSSSGQFLDQYDKFGVHIASQLRELPLWNFVVLQEKIQCLITSERLSCIEPPRPSLHASPNTNEQNSNY